MEIIGAICLTLIILVILAAAAILYFNKKDDSEKIKEESPTKYTNEEKVKIQFEKAKAEIETLHQKANLYKSISDLIGLICTILIIGVLLGSFILIATLTSCAGITSKF